MRLQKSRHAVVDRLHEFVRLAGNDSEGALPLVRLRVLPELPETGHAERLLAMQCDFILLLLLALRHLLPLKDRICRKDDAAFEKGMLPELGSLDAFGAGIKEEPVGELEPPAHEFELALPVRIDRDDRLHGTRRDVVLGAEVKVFDTCGHIESVGDALLVRFAAVTATHSLPATILLLVSFFSEKKPHTEAVGNLFIGDENTAV